MINATKLRKLAKLSENKEITKILNYLSEWHDEHNAELKTLKDSVTAKCLTNGFGFVPGYVPHNIRYKGVNK